MKHLAKATGSKRRNRQSEDVAQALTLAIHQHKIAPGTKLGEDDLGEIFGVSRTIVRAALHELSHRRLVEIERNRGAFVAQPSLREAREVFEARELLEPKTAFRAATKATEADIALLNRHIEGEHAAIASEDHGAAVHLSGQFHVEIARIADQATIAHFIEALVARSSLIIALYWSRKSALCEKHAHHGLIQAIAAGDGQRAEELMLSHLVDLHSALDLREGSRPGRSLREALTG